MAFWRKVGGAGKALCLLCLVGVMVAAASGLLRPVDAVFLVLGVVLFGVACAVGTGGS